MSIRFHLTLLAVIAALVVGAWEYRADLRRVFDALLVVQDMVPAVEQSWLDQETPAPTFKPIAYQARGRTYQGELVEPGTPPKGALVLIPGADQAGRTHPAFRDLAETLARAGFTILMPEVPGLRGLELRADGAQAIADAAIYLGQASDGTVGMLAVSYAVGPMMLAALDADVAARVDWLLGIGGYHDSTAVITFLTTGFHRNINGAWYHREPAPYAKWAFLKANAALLPDPQDGQYLASLAASGGAPDGLAMGLPLGLGGGARAVMALLDNKQPEKVPALMAELPITVSKEIAALNLAQRDFSALKPKLILVHGRDDPLIPATQSQALAAAVPEDRVDLTILQSLKHVTFDAFSVGDAYRLWRVVYMLLHERDRTTP
ncbi:alpha/beta hydrolase [Magnetospira sp. QH-2]|uniref:alpha/beta hydrolase n=1 Tax=Magnetospira sp. (strain QH-2) TaxID=1288970 RepID=UPI0003E81884|nr:alpha/beta hydrolase [Magnetospira sp. QH-2]CCQ73039.1 conserved exported protein of unknown function [Magnetospira sp. QH-2]